LLIRARREPDGCQPRGAEQHTVVTPVRTWTYTRFDTLETNVRANACFHGASTLWACDRNGTKEAVSNDKTETKPIARPEAVTIRDHDALERAVPSQVSSRWPMTLPALVDGALPIKAATPDAISTLQIGAIYATSLLEVAQRFATSDRRIVLLGGLLRLRRDLRAVGIDNGTQWINGSFLDVARDDNGRPREPNDIDVVTFCSVANATGSAAPFTGDRGKETYGVDHYFLFYEYAPQDLVEATAYWYELWSTRRHPPGSRKGFAQVSLDPAEDDAVVNYWKSPAAKVK
jgi:hypothetical protein